MKEETGAEARALLSAAYQGVLSTHSQDMPGFPFGSVAPYCLDADGCPLLLISDIAQHTKNLRADARCSFIVMQGGEDIQAGARLTLVGDCRPLPPENVEAAAARYYRYFPEARDFHRTHDFHFFRLVPARCRYIGGFGRIHWLAADAVLRANPFTAEREAGIVGHMNDDHADALRHYCQQAGIVLPAEVAPVDTPLAAREALVAMARAGR